jgi:hypothetical protein
VNDFQIFVIRAVVQSDDREIAVSTDVHKKEVKTVEESDK